MEQSTALSWSGGKNSILALRELLSRPAHGLRFLFSTFSRDRNLTIHTVPETLLELQAASLGMELEKIVLPEPCPLDEYESLMSATMERFRSEGISRVAYGDIHLQKIRNYREKNLSPWDLTALFPLWERDSRELSHLFLEEGYRAIVVSVDTTRIPSSFAGRHYNQEFLEDLEEISPAVDPWGREGEFHTFVFDGPSFQFPVEFEIKDFSLKADRFQICNLKSSIPVQSGTL